MRILRDSFGGVNARFHLVGFYTLVELLLYIAADMSGRLKEDDPLSDAAVAAVMVIFCLACFTYCGVRGAFYHAAIGRRQPGFMHDAVALLLPFLWVGIKIALLVTAPALGAAALYMAIVAPGGSPERPIMSFFFWSSPVFGLVAQILALYAMPLSIIWRESGAPRAQIRQGLRLFLEFPGETLRLLVIVAAAGALEAAIWYARGPEAKEISLDIPFVLILFGSSYLELVAFFGATRVIRARFDPESRRDRAGEPDTGAPGPPA